MPLIKLLRRKQRRRDARYGVDLAIVLKEILIWANELVPSESGSILLDDPVVKMRSGKDANIHFVACYGKGSGPLVGTFIKDKHGIAGETYRTGKPYISADVKKDSKFFSGIDKKTGFKTMSIIAAPIINRQLRHRRHNGLRPLLIILPAFSYLRSCLSEKH